jgi:deoxyadenosine/deoxycytidine kinase
VELKHRYIVVEGPIGVGKTSLTRALCKRFGARGVFEIVEENHFLASFYQDRNKFAFPVAIDEKITRAHDYGRLCLEFVRKGKS